MEPKIERKPHTKQKLLSKRSVDLFMVYGVGGSVNDGGSTGGRGGDGGVAGLEEGAGGVISAGVRM